MCSHEVVDALHMYIRVEPASNPILLALWWLSKHPTASLEPSAERDIDSPKSSALNSPLMSDPICVHDEPLSSYTFTAPGGSEEVDDRDFRGIPTATRLPSDDNETEWPNSSNP